MNTPEQQPAQGSLPGKAPQPAAAAPTPATPKRKRWKKVLLITGGVLLGLILVVLAVGPTIIGSVAASKIPAILNEKFQANVTLGGVSFSWTGHLQIDDFRMVPKNFSDPLVEVKKVDVKVDVGSALGGKYIADVEVVAPK